MTRYAKRTKVPVATTKAAIDTLLAKHGAFQRALATDERAGLNLVMFSLNVGNSQRQVRLEIKHHGDDAQEERRVWRVLYMSLKMKLERIAYGDTTVDAEFLPNVVLPDGRTVLGAMGEQLDRAYMDGGMPPLLGTGQ